jgi:hypothetical protein
MTDISYAFKWGEAVAQWRCLKCNIMEKIDNPNFNGPAIAANFRW